MSLCALRGSFCCGWLPGAGALVGCQALPRVVTPGLLVSEAKSQHGWLHGLGNPRTVTGLMVGKIESRHDWVGGQDWCWLAGGRRGKPPVLLG